MFENLFRNVASMAYLVGFALVITTDMIGTIATDPTSPPVIGWWDLTRILLCAFCGFMAARLAGACFGANIDLYQTKAVTLTVSVEVKSVPAQDDGSTPPTA